MNFTYNYTFQNCIATGSVPFGGGGFTGPYGTINDWNNPLGFIETPSQTGSAIFSVTTLGNGGQTSSTLLASNPSGPMIPLTQTVTGILFNFVYSSGTTHDHIFNGLAATNVLINSTWGPWLSSIYSGSVTQSASIPSGVKIYFNSPAVLTVPMANVQSPSLAGYISLYGFNAINPSDIPNIQYGLEGVFPLATGLGDGDLLKVSSLTMTVYTKLVVPRRRSYVSLVSKLP